MNTSKSTKTNFKFLEQGIVYTQKNYLLMILGVFFIALGFFLMTGSDANTRPDGTFDPNYFNEGIFSIKRIRIAPFFVVLGFVVEAFAILYLPKKSN